MAGVGNCSWCQHSFQNPLHNFNTKPVRLDCAHIIHQSCIIGIEDECPQCRESIPKIEKTVHLVLGAMTPLGTALGCVFSLSSRVQNWAATQPDRLNISAGNVAILTLTFLSFLVSINVARSTPVANQITRLVTWGYNAWNQTAIKASNVIDARNIPPPDMQPAFKKAIEDSIKSGSSKVENLLSKPFNDEERAILKPLIASLDTSDDSQLKSRAKLFTAYLRSNDTELYDRVLQNPSDQDSLKDSVFNFWVDVIDSENNLILGPQKTVRLCMVSVLEEHKSDFMVKKEEWIILLNSYIEKCRRESYLLNQVQDQLEEGFFNHPLADLLLYSEYDERIFEAIKATNPAAFNG
ncbi:MAG: hypothetical protein ABSA17_03350 [Rhabdochlamydiaceae bacterium]|jgi:hypothetical protein